MEINAMEKKSYKTFNGFVLGQLFFSSAFSALSVQLEARLYVPPTETKSHPNLNIIV